MSLRKYIFDLYPSPPDPKDPVASDLSYLYTDSPVIMLEEIDGAVHPRTTPQRTVLATSGLVLVNPALGLDRDTAYRAYVVHRPGAPEVPSNTPPKNLLPLANVPSEAISVTRRKQQLIDAHNNVQPCLDHSDAQPKQTLYLFNVLVALEWIPGEEELERLKWGFRQASDLLYDVTNGTMAFGQVIFGDVSCMDAADIQIMASNRLLPRSWVSGLLEDKKYMPIRVGRGVWSKRTQIAIPWNEYEAFSALVHEWGHYALNQRDEYLATTTVSPNQPRTASGAGRLRPTSDPGLKIVIPTHRSKAESIMSRPNGMSELANPIEIPGWKQHYPYLQMPSKAYAGPNRLPLPLPYFRYISDFSAAQECLIDTPLQCLKPMKKSGKKELLDQPFSVYVLHHNEDGTERVIAQGTFDATTPTQGFRLLGATAGDTILVIGDIINDGNATPTVWQGTYPGCSDQNITAVAWNETKPSTNLSNITVEPEVAASAKRMPGESPGDLNAGISSAQQAADQRVRKIKIASSNGVSMATTGVSVTAHEIGTGEQVSGDPVTKFVPVSSLDGHLVIKQNGQPIMINPYSQGGGPATAPNVVKSPITAGSADGEALLFFDAEKELADISADPTDPARIARKAEHAKVRIVTTTLPDAPEGPVPDKKLSNAFGIVSNALIPKELYPTLVIIMDPNAIPYDRHVFIHRLDGSTWTPLDTYVAPDSSFAAASLVNDSQNNTLFIPDADLGTRLRREYYCLCAIAES